MRHLLPSCLLLLSPSLIRAERMPAGASWKEPLAEAQATVQMLRDVEKVQAVVFIGHQHRQDDEAMAKAVPPITSTLDGRSGDN